MKPEHDGRCSEPAGTRTRDRSRREGGSRETTRQLGLARGEGREDLGRHPLAEARFMSTRGAGRAGVGEADSRTRDGAVYNLGIEGESVLTEGGG